MTQILLRYCKFLKVHIWYDQKKKNQIYSNDRLIYKDMILIFILYVRHMIRWSKCVFMH